MTSFPSEQLRTFLTVLEQGTFDAAAHVLHVTPSAVSQRIKALEQTAGQILLERRTPVRVTPAGAVVHGLARQLRQLEADAAAALGLGSGRTTLAVVVNADSLATWFLEALLAVPPTARLAFEVLSRDEQESVQLLRSGEVMAAVTATPTAVPGCSVTALGAMSYRAVVAATAWPTLFPAGPSPDALAAAPVVHFDRSDTLQLNFLRQIGAGAPRGVQHFLPDSRQFAHAVRRGLGWGLLPRAQCEAGLRSGALLELFPGTAPRIPLFWQRWKIASPALDALSAAVMTAAGDALEPAPPLLARSRPGQT